MWRLILAIDDELPDEGLHCAQCGTDKELAEISLDEERNGNTIKGMKVVVCAECFMKTMEERVPGFMEYVHDVPSQTTNDTAHV